jgi:hypothetical protein
VERDKHGGLLLLSTQKQLYGTQPLLSVHIIQKRKKGERPHMEYQMDENTGTGLLLWNMGRSERVRQEEEQRRIHHIRMSLWRTRFITGIGMLVGLFYASGAAITYSISVKAPESTLERVLIGLAVSTSFYALNSIARTLEKQKKK